MAKLTHLDEHGAARMVDVSGKDATEREAEAEALVILSGEAFDAISKGTAAKGDVLATARVAGIMGAKKTSELIPLCHPIALAKASIDFELLAESHSVRVVARAKTTGQTGVEMEALTAASVAALTIYDMIKAVDRTARIDGIRLLSKSGGKSGSFSAHRETKASAPIRPAGSPAPRPRAHPEVLPGGVASRPRADAGAAREAFRTFMTTHRLRATKWAKEAGVPASHIYAYLTGRARNIPGDSLEKLARAARVRAEDMFR